VDIVLDGLGKTYGSRAGETTRALEGVSTTFNSGEFVTLIGPSGCGKSTLLNIVSGLVTPTDGTVRIGTRSVHGGSNGDGVAAPRVGLIFQKPVLLAWRTALENVYLPGELGTDPPGRTDGDRLRARAQELLELVGLAGFEDKYPWELSGGMQQRVAIARALLLEASVMCLDEPFAALDEFTREQMLLELLQIWHTQRFTGIFVTHNIFESAFLSDRVLVMTPRPGRVVADIAIDLPRPRTRDMFGSEAFAANVNRIRQAMEEHWEDA
jgi:NitT/TauT family transport system ATP-binding protein